MWRLVGLFPAIACLGWVAPASASVTFGAELTTGDSGVAEPCTNWMYAADGPSGCVSTFASSDNSDQVPIKGVITSFSIRMADAVSGRLRTARFADNSQPLNTTMTFKGTGPDVSVPGDSAVHSFPVRLSVVPGDVIGFASSSSAIHRTLQGNHLWRLDRDGPDGSTGIMAVESPHDVTSYEVPI